MTYEESRASGSISQPSTGDRSPRQRLRLRFAKGRALKYISHLDLARTWERVFRRARLPVAYSQGFNPRPRYQIAAALPVGVTGRAEYLDLWLTASLPPAKVSLRLQPALPRDLELVGIEEVELRAPSLQSQMRSAEYRALVQSPEPVAAVRARVQALLDAPTLLRQRHHKGKLQTFDLRPLIQDVNVQPGEEGQLVLAMRLQASPQGAGRPDIVLEALGLSLVPHTIERTNLCFEFDK
jgi:radical SAM-linked protein